MSSPMFSVIIPSHNGAETIGTALKSVLQQTYDNYQLIVVCDACEDNTAQIAEEYGAEVVSIDAHCEGLARNAGLDKATGNWILFLDDDDYFIHEYCFDMLANKVMKSDADVVNFAFIWKGRGYQTPRSTENQMAWARAWRRKFIGKRRFDNAPYGTDKNFYHAVIESDPEVKIDYYDTPVIYYNYMRKGSMSEVLKQQKQLDIIVTHYDEPWNVCKPFFDMIEHQRIADKYAYAVTLVQDGEETALHWDKLLSGYSFDVNVVTIPHSGTAAARNAGMKESSGDWIMFCDIDDLFCDVCSLQMILSQFPIKNMDMIWGKMVNESKWNGSGRFMNCVTELNPSTTHCKFYRRAFLEEKNIQFDTRFPLHYQYMFNAVVAEETDPFRIATLTTDFYVYYKTIRENSMLNNTEAQKKRINTMFDRDVALSCEFYNRGKTYAANKRIVMAMYDEFLRVYTPDEEQRTELSESFIEFFRNYRDIYHSMEISDREVLYDIVESEKMNFIQEMYNDFMIENYFVNDEMDVHSWIRSLDDTPFQTTPTTVIKTDKPASQGHEPRVAVYCGTYNTYMNMIASAKSLLWHTKMDKIYFLTEDDEFPYELPDIIENINVSNQDFFPKDGPNYHNSWSYMCMTRAIFSKLIPYDKVLSLDIDVVIQEDISCLWDYDMTDYYLAGVIEPQRQKSAGDPIYINFGVVMMNLNKIRSNGIDDQVINALNTEKFGCPEQDAFNKYCARHILQLPNDYNATVYSHITGDAEKERILHYAGIKFWRHFGSVREYGQRDWETIMNNQEKLT